LLQDRLVRTARNLHRACEDVARQNDLLAAKRRQPSAVEYRSAAKWWRALADQALAVAYVWTENTDSPSALACSTCGGPLPWEVLLLPPWATTRGEPHRPVEMLGDESKVLRTTPSETSAWTSTLVIWRPPRTRRRAGAT